MFYTFLFHFFSFLTMVFEEIFRPDSNNNNNNEPKLFLEIFKHKNVNKSSFGISKSTAIKKKMKERNEQQISNVKLKCLATVCIVKISQCLFFSLFMLLFACFSSFFSFFGFILLSDGRMNLLTRHFASHAI